MTDELPAVRRVATADLTPTEIADLRTLLVSAFGTDAEERFSDADWGHAVGGVHFVLEVDGEFVTHASVVERDIHVADRPFRTGYVEAVATAPGRQGAGFGSHLMTDVTAYIRERFELGVLGTGRHHFYERLGWVTWLGPAYVRLAAGGVERTPDEEGYILLLDTPASGPLDPTAAISCEWRKGDVW